MFKTGLNWLFLTFKLAFRMHCIIFNDTSMIFNDTSFYFLQEVSLVINIFISTI